MGNSKYTCNHTFSNVKHLNTILMWYFDMAGDFYVLATQFAII